MKKDKNLDALSRYALKEAGHESPSETFVSDVMDRIHREPAHAPVPVYQPVISRRAWFIIMAGIIAISVFLLTSSSTVSLEVLKPEVNMSGWMEQINIFKSMQLSNLIFISVMVFAVMGLVQFYLIKNYSSRLAV